MGGLIGKLLSFVRAERNGAKLSDIKIDVGGGEVLTAELAQGSGDDAVPLPDDYAMTVRAPGSGRLVVVGYVEPDAEQTAIAGERRLYSRDETRAEVAQFHLKNDGTAVLSNANGTFTLAADGTFTLTTGDSTLSIGPDGTHRGENVNGFYELQAGGTMDINGATIDTSGNISAANITGQAISGQSVSAPSVVADGKELAGHDHAINSGSSAPGPTGANN